MSEIIERHARAAEEAPAGGEGAASPAHRASARAATSASTE